MFVLYEDEIILVVNKPSGLVVNRSPTWDGDTLEDYIIEHLGIPGDGIGGRAGIVHRLDKDTSGALVVAKTEEAFENLSNQFRTRKVEKKYLGLSYGKVVPEKGLIDAPMGRNPKNRIKMAVVEGGRRAVTVYEVLNYYKKGKRFFSLLQLSPETGRTHQLRVHMTSLAHPLVGDRVYSGRKRYEQDSSWCLRLFLHAVYLEFNHPVNGERVGYEAPLPEMLQEIVDGLAQD